MQSLYHPFSKTLHTKSINTLAREIPIEPKTDSKPVSNSFAGTSSATLRGSVNPTIKNIVPNQDKLVKKMEPIKKGGQVKRNNIRLVI